MKTKHTQGEWKSFNSTISSDDKMLPIAEVQYDIEYPEESQANAKLIAAAPELLKNLIRCVDRLEENHLGHMSAVRRAREAIKKATE